MGYTIVYDRGYLKVSENIFIPIVQLGCNNVFDFGANGQMIPAKNWTVINLNDRSKYLYTRAEIKELAEWDAGRDGTPHKSRYKQFEVKEWEKFIENGVKHALTVEQYLEHGNTIIAYPEGSNYGETPITYRIETTRQLLEFIFRDNGRGKLRIKFINRDLKRPKQKRKRREKKFYNYFYALKKEENYGCRYLVRLTKYGYKYQPYQSSSNKKFASEKAARKYLEKYRNRLEGFEPVLIQEEAYM